jgi:hypothetical protein
VTHAYNSGNLRGKYGEDHGLKPILVKNSRDPISTKSQMWWNVSVILVIMGNINKRIMVQVSPGKK